MIPELEFLSGKLASRIQTNRISLVETSADCFRVEPQIEDGFPLSVSYIDEKYEIEAVWWHSHYQEPIQAFAAICWLLTPYYRIVGSFRGEESISTWLEQYTDEGWEPHRYVYFVDPATLESPVDNADLIKIRTQAVFLDASFANNNPGAQLDQAGYPVGTILGEASYERRNDEWHPIGIPEAE